MITAALTVGCVSWGALSARAKLVSLRQCVTQVSLPPPMRKPSRCGDTPVRDSSQSDQSWLGAHVSSWEIIQTHTCRYTTLLLTWGKVLLHFNLHWNTMEYIWISFRWKPSSFIINGGANFTIRSNFKAPLRAETLEQSPNNIGMTSAWKTESFQKTGWAKISKLTGDPGSTIELKPKSNEADIDITWMYIECKAGSMSPAANAILIYHLQKMWE